MNRNGIVIGTVIALILLAGAAYALVSRNTDTADTTGQTNTTVVNPTPAPTPTPTPAGNTGTNPETQSQSTITYNGSGFTPSALTVKANTTVTVNNTSTEELQFNSDPHPDHTENTELNVGTVAPGQSKTFTATKTGTWGFHNHLDQTEKGSITVQ